MAAGEVARYASEMADALRPLGVTAAELQTLTDAANDIEVLLASAPPIADEEAVTAWTASWDGARQRWVSARDAIQDRLADVLLGALKDLPGLRDVLADTEEIARSGVHADVVLGPVALSVRSATLVVAPPDLPGDALAVLGSNRPGPLPVGPFPIGQIEAAIRPPLGDAAARLPGGGSIVRLPRDGGYGGTLQLPLGPVQVSAAALLSMPDGRPSFLAILGIGFLPPVQLSFGFSLDRVGGVVGIDRAADLDALRAAVRTGTAGDVLFAARPPASPLELVSAANALFRPHEGTPSSGPPAAAGSSAWPGRASPGCPAC